MFSSNRIKILTFFNIFIVFAGLAGSGQAADEKLWKAMVYLNPQAVKNALEEGANPNMLAYDDEVDEDEKNDTMLHIAARAGSPEIVQALLAAGADKDAKNAGGLTPLHVLAKSSSSIAAETGADVAKTLLDAGADKDAKTSSGKTPLYFAAGRKNSDVLLQLIKAGVDKEAFDEYGNRPLHVAAQGGSLDVLSHLIKGGVDVNVENNNGDRPIHRAAANLKSKNIKMLFDNGADVRALNKQGENIVQIAHRATSNYHHPEIPKIDKLFEEYSQLHNSPKALEERKTLFGQTVMKAYHAYVYDYDPRLLAAMLGIDKTARIPTKAIRRAKNMFVLDGDGIYAMKDEDGNPVVDQHGKLQFEHTGEPVFLYSLHEDYQNT